MGRNNRERERERERERGGGGGGAPLLVEISCVCECTEGESGNPSILSHQSNTCCISTFQLNLTYIPVGINKYTVSIYF